MRFCSDESSAVEKCEEARQDNNYLSYYSKTILPPCQVYANSPVKDGREIVWNEAEFIVSSDKFFAARKVKKSADDFDILLQELPIFMYREKLRNYILDHREDTHWAFAMTPRFCPTNWQISWNKSEESELRDRVRQRCDARFSKRSSDWSKYTNVDCKCQVVMLDGKLQVAKNNIQGLLKTVATMYIEQGEQKVTLRGMIEYEISKLKPQKVGFYNKDGQLICGGGMNPSISDDGGFKLTCQGLGFTATGITRVITGGKMHSIGSGKTDQGGRFVFVTALMPDDLAEIHPEYFGEK